MKVGVWLDKERAIIVTIYDGQVSTNTLLSNIEHFHIHGGSGTRLKGGPQDVIQDSKYLEREKIQLKKYFHDIAMEIKDAEVIVLFGPGETRVHFQKELTTSFKDLGAKVKAVIKTDSMTTRQVKAWAKTFFKSTK